MKRILPIILLTAFLIAACGSAQSAPVYDSVGAYPMEAPAAVSEESFVPVSSEGDSLNPADTSRSAGNAAPIERIVIQNADISIVVSDVEGRMKNIQILAEQLGGFVVSSNLGQTYTSNYVEVPEASLVIRVPSEKLEDALDQIKKGVVEVQSEYRSGQDVTADYVDLKSRLKNLEAAEAKLNEIMEQAVETEDVVNVFNQLVYYREQIEVAKGQINYYEEAAALSAITIRIIAEETVKPIEIGGWEPKGVAAEAVQDLIYFYQDFVDFILRFFIFTLPVLITVGIPLYLFFLILRALYRKASGLPKWLGILFNKITGRKKEPELAMAEPKQKTKAKK